VSSDVLVVGAGPVGLTVAVELRRRGVECRIVDRLAQAPPYAKAVGIQPRTLEVWENQGLLRDALDAAAPMRGQLVFVNGRQVSRLDLALPPDVPFGFNSCVRRDSSAAPHQLNGWWPRQPGPVNSQILQAQNWRRPRLTFVKRVSGWRRRKRRNRPRWMRCGRLFLPNARPPGPAPGNCQSRQRSPCEWSAGGLTRQMLPSPARC